MSDSLAQIVQINVNPQGGVPKHAVSYAQITVDGVIGDKQRDLKHHGGPQRAVSLFAIERITDLQAEGHPISAGSTGENLTISGLNWDDLAPGTRLRIGLEVELEITGYASPCQIIKESFKEHTFSRMSQKTHPGWSRLYASVIQEGVVHAGDRVEVE